jgi:hypothetical protein
MSSEFVLEAVALGKAYAIFKHSGYWLKQMLAMGRKK